MWQKGINPVRLMSHSGEFLISILSDEESKEACGERVSKANLIEMGRIIGSTQRRSSLGTSNTNKDSGIFGQGEETITK